MHRTIRPDHQGEIPIFTFFARSGHIEDSLRVFEQGVHVRDLSAEIPVFPEENSNHWCAANV
jgi:hypothetical protein